jgi:putative flippase GtrA
MLPRMARFLSVGAVGTLLDISLFTALHILLNVPTLLANTLSYSAGIINNYLLHRNWTYADRSRKKMGAQFSQFALVSLSALVLNNLLVLWLTPRFDLFFANVPYGAILAKVFATGVGVCWNFFANNSWTFDDSTKGAQQ